jgi:GT2 family glycosyltransferase
MKEKATISIVLITYNRPADLLELLQNISTLEETERLCEVVIVNNRSTADYSAVEEFIDQQKKIPFRYIYAEENLGVSRGRNFAIQQSTGSLLLFLDDDALLRTKDALIQLPLIFADPTVGIAAFKVFYQATGYFQKTAFPHKQFEKYKELPHFETYYFSGCAHAIRRECF